jgi:hypothetical protein
MKRAILSSCAISALFTGLSSTPQIPKGRQGSLILKGFEPKKGGHCESSAMLNALGFLGYGLSEADIAGGGGAPSFLFTNDGFPFIGGRNDRMREAFLDSADIPFTVVIPKDGDDGWDDIVSLLDRGLPVLLRVDMRYLPYLYGGKYGGPHMSFGWHWVCLYAIDFGSSQALVTDTERGGPCSVALADLEKARGSNTKVFPPKREYAWIEERPATWAFDPDKVTRQALATILTNYDGTDAWGLAQGKGDRASMRSGAPTLPLQGLAGLSAFPQALSSLHCIVKPFLLAPAYSFMADSIERNGTGGAAFRGLFRDFLAARAQDCADPRLRSSCACILPKAEAAVQAWSALATAFDTAADELGRAHGGPSRNDALARAETTTADRAQSLYSAEYALRESIATAKVQITEQAESPARQTKGEANHAR